VNYNECVLNILQALSDLFVNRSALDLTVAVRITCRLVTATHVGCVLHCPLAGGQWSKTVNPESMMLPTVNTWIAQCGGAANVPSPTSFGGASGLNNAGKLSIDAFNLSSAKLKVTRQSE
jgi:hypothetical protein